MEPVESDGCPVYLNIALMVRIFNVTKQACYRWNTESPGRKRALPYPPDRMVGTMPLWEEATILAWAEKRGLRVDHGELDRIRVEQGVRPLTSV